MATNKNTNGKTDKFDIYQEVTDRIIEQLKEGNIPWNKPWTCVSNSVVSGAFNRVTKKPYSLLNQMLLMHEGEYASYKQWQSLGGQVRKGEKSEIVVFWKIIQTDDVDSDGNVRTDKNGNVKKKSVPILKYYRVFHISQVDGVEPLEIDDSTYIGHEPIEVAENIKLDFMQREDISIREVEGDRAFYSVVCDHIVTPLMEQFSDVAEYYSTLFHECCHATGAKHRLGRFDMSAKIAAFGTPDYSKEELVAECGSAMLMSHCGIETDVTFRNSAAYIQGWLAALSNDKRLIVSAASRAEKAAKWVLYGKDMKPAEVDDVEDMEGVEDMAA